MKKVLLVIVVAICLFLFFSYKLTDIPAGITGDEAAFGYNGVLLSRTLHDENGRFLPVFVLSLQGKDWRQPVTQYSIVTIFKILGPSLFNLRLVSVLTAVASVILIFFLAKEIFGKNYAAIFASLIMIITPIFMIQSHLALDNVTPVPFVIAWLYSLIRFSKTKKKYWLILAGVFLGAGFYAYKSMRLFVPVWAVLTFIHIVLTEKRKAVLPSVIFAVGIFPFLTAIPVLEYLYAGAVLNHGSLEISSIYGFFYPFLTNFDPSFLFVKGDSLLFHSTGVHGMYLLASVPFFVLGLIYLWKKELPGKFLVVSFFLGPLLFGYIGEVHRASRLLPEIPFYSLIAAGGLVYLWERKKNLVPAILLVLLAVNYFDFIHYYWLNYAADTANLYNCFSCADSAFKYLKSESDKRGAAAYIDQSIVGQVSPGMDFARAIYFAQKPASWDGDWKSLPAGSILMTENSKVFDLVQINHISRYYFYKTP